MGKIDNDFIDKPAEYVMGEEDELTYLREVIKIKTHEYQEREKSFQKKFEDGILKAEAVTGLMDQLIVITNDNNQLREEIANLNGTIHNLENTVIDYSVESPVLAKLSLDGVFEFGKGSDGRFRFSNNSYHVDIDEADLHNLIGELQGFIDDK